MKNPPADECESYQRYPEHRHTWLNRLWLAERLGYQCGLRGFSPPTADYWFIKPVYNLMGMGVGARRGFFTGNIWECEPPGPSEFWMPLFVGQHLSLDLEWVVNGSSYELVIKDAVEATWRRGRIYEWIRHAQVPRAGAPIQRIAKLTRPLWRLGHPFNVEMIGGNIIEIHLRPGTDFEGYPEADAATPVWYKDDIYFFGGREATRPPSSMVPNYDSADQQLDMVRVGFLFSRGGQILPRKD